MAFSLPDLPYAKNALQPHISAETLTIHHGKHHNGYVTKLNAQVQADPSLQGKSLEELIALGSGGVFNNAAQVWNHTFYWQSLSPTGGGAPIGALASAIQVNFGSFEAFKKQFTAAALGQFGSGWAWLVQDIDGKLQVTATGNAGNPLTLGLKPILTCDVWEHAYYVDYHNRRADYIAAWWNLVNWDFATKNLS